MAFQPVFCASPLAFMQDNIVYVAFPNDTSGLVDVTIDLRAPAGVISNNAAYGVYKLRLAREREAHVLRVYVCPYAQDSLQSIMLGNGALWCFTPTMDGCTFGVGSQGAGASGNVLVGHVNTNKAGQAVGDLGINAHRAQQRKLQRNLMRSKVGLDAMLIEPSTYMSEGTEGYKLKSTTFGSHAANGAWTFHTQRYRYSGNTFFHGGVRNYP